MGPDDITNTDSAPASKRKAAAKTPSAKRASQRTASKSSPTAAANKLGFSPTDKTKQAAAQAPNDHDAIPADGTLPQLTDDLRCH